MSGKSELLQPDRNGPDESFKLWERGRDLHSDGKYIEAGLCYGEAVSAYVKNPRHKKPAGYALNNLGIIMGMLGHHEKATRCFLEALVLCPNNPQILNNFGNTCVSAGDYERGKDCFLKSIRGNPKLMDARLNAAVLQLLTGNLPRGWREYEVRWSAPGFGTPLFKSKKPRWRGKSLDGKTLLLTHEQGFGDTIQFIRYVPLIKERHPTSRIRWVGPKELCNLLRHVEGLDEVMNELNDDEYDYHSPLLSLPGIFGTRLGNIPASIPYFKFPPTGFDKLPHLSVAICWAGRAEYGNDKWRSTKLEQWAPILSVPGVKFYSVQVGVPQSQVTGFPAITDLSPNISDYVDTARYFQDMDLLISVDSSVVHLAGALGLETWMLTPFNPDWRWLLGTERSEWYPALRLFRQPAKDAWAPVFERVRAELEKRVNA